METSVISKIAEQVLYKGAKVPESLQAKKGEAYKGDKVDISPEVAQKIKDIEGKVSLDQDRDLKLERIRTMIQNRDYPGKEEITGKIADKIITNLL